VSLVFLNTMDFNRSPGILRKEDPSWSVLLVIRVPRGGMVGLVVVSFPELWVAVGGVRAQPGYSLCVPVSGCLVPGANSPVGAPPLLSVRSPFKPSRLSTSPSSAHQSSHCELPPTEFGFVAPASKARSNFRPKGRST